MHDPDAAARKALRLIGADPPNWVPDHPGIDHNVIIVGGGQTGCAIAFALRRAGSARSRYRRRRGRGGGRHLAECGADEFVAHAEDAAGAGIRIPALSFQGGTKRARRASLCGDRPHPADGLGRVSRLVSPVPRHPDPLPHQAVADRASRRIFPPASGDSMAQPGWKRRGKSCLPTASPAMAGLMCRRC